MSEQDCKKLRIIAGINILWPLATAVLATVNVHQNPHEIPLKMEWIHYDDEMRWCEKESDSTDLFRHLDPVVFAWIGFG